MANWIRKGIALDIDGVLLRGGKTVPRAAQAIQTLQKHKVPHIYVTNGGGCTEAAKAQDLTKKLGVSVTADQVLLSHTPMRTLSQTLNNSRVLVLGHPGCVQVAESYGFQKVSTAEDILKEVPSIYPGHRKLDGKPPRHPGEPISAVLLLHDPVDWALEMQVLTDILLHGADYHQHKVENPHNHDGSWKQAVPFYACNADLIYTTEYPRPRFTQGAFTEAFRCLFEQFTGTPLNIHFCGKPFEIQYRFAEEMIAQQAKALGVPTPEQFYGVGDNPASDIRGANGAGDHWTSILVKTGLFRGQENDPIDPAHAIVEDVHDAVEFASKH